MPSLIYGCFINGSCYSSLVQATSLNKQHVIQNVFRLTAHDAADYDEAIAFGMKLLSIFSAGRPVSAHCNKILVLISDSDIQYNDTTIQILERYKDYVRLFTYSLSTITGPGPLTDVTKRIKGAFAQIPVIGALSNILRHFTDHATHYGSTKKLHPQKLDLVVHHAADIFPFKIAEEIGPMASLTMAVYNRTVGLDLLGIMGTDVSAREMVDLLQTYLNSPTDYAFMVDNNGFVLFHPLLKSYRKLSAQTIDIDMMDIEASNVTEFLTVRTNLIDNRENVTILDDFAVFMDEVHAHRTLRTYAYTPIPETEYSICLVTATDRDIDVQFLSQKEHLQITSDTILVDGEDISPLLLPVDVVLSPILANCRKPSFSRILAPPTTTATSTTSATTKTATTSPEPVITELTTVELPKTTTLPLLDGLYGPYGLSESTESTFTPESTIFNNDSGDKLQFRRKRNWLTSFYAEDSKGVEQIMRILRFVQEYDFGNSFYEGHFMSDLLVGLNVLRVWESSQLSKNTISRSVFFTSGLGFIYPSHMQPEFKQHMTADFANSSIWQRVLDSHGLLFWIQPKLEALDLSHTSLSDHWTTPEATLTADDEVIFTPDMIEPKYILKREIVQNSSSSSDLSTLMPHSSYAEKTKSDFSTLTSSFSNALHEIMDNRSLDVSVTRAPIFDEMLWSKINENVKFESSMSEEPNMTITEPPFTSMKSQELVTNAPALERPTLQPKIASLPRVTVFLGSQASQNEFTNTFAVAGLTLSEAYLQEVLNDFSQCDTENTCYLLDDAAFVIAVNNERLNYQVGHFLGNVDPSLMESLLANSVYSRVKYYDYQAVCDSALLGEKNCTSSSPRILPVIVQGLCQVFTSSFWLSFLQKIAAVVVKLTNIFIVFSQMCINTFALGQDVDYMNCVKSTYRYYSTDGSNFGKESVSSAEILGNFTCSPSCTRRWSASSIPETNLKLLKTDPVCACFKKDYDWKLTPSIAEDISICQSASNPRYRRPIIACMK